MGPLLFLWYPLSGFLCVHGYRKRTGFSPTLGEGAKLGGITGVFSFGISLLLVALNSLLPSDRPDLSESLRQQLSRTAMDEEIRGQVLQIIDDPGTLAALLLLAILAMLGVAIGLTVVGGVLGAKVLEDE